MHRETYRKLGMYDCTTYLCSQIPHQPPRGLDGVLKPNFWNLGAGVQEIRDGIRHLVGAFPTFLKKRHRAGPPTTRPHSRWTKTKGGRIYFVPKKKREKKQCGNKAAPWPGAYLVDAEGASELLEGLGRVVSELEGLVELVGRSGEAPPGPSGGEHVLVLLEARTDRQTGRQTQDTQTRRHADKQTRRQADTRKGSRDRATRKMRSSPGMEISPVDTPAECRHAKYR